MNICAKDGCGCREANVNAGRVSQEARAGTVLRVAPQHDARVAGNEQAVLRRPDGNYWVAGGLVAEDIGDRISRVVVGGVIDVKATLAALFAPKRARATARTQAGVSAGRRPCT